MRGQQTKGSSKIIARILEGGKLGAREWSTAGIVRFVEFDIEKTNYQ
jgi:hypothetical protein